MLGPCREPSILILTAIRGGRWWWWIKRLIDLLELTPPGSDGVQCPEQQSDCTGGALTTWLFFGSLKGQCSRSHHRCLLLFTGKPSGDPQSHSLPSSGAGPRYGNGRVGSCSEVSPPARLVPGLSCLPFTSLPWRMMCWLVTWWFFFSWSLWMNYDHCRKIRKLDNQKENLFKPSEVSISVYPELLLTAWYISF